MKNLYVKDLIEHLAENVKETFYLRSITLKRTQNNDIPYMLLRLEDKTGSVFGKIWDTNMDDSYLHLHNSVVTVCGELILNHNQQPELALWRVDPIINYEIGDYINGLPPEESARYMHFIYNYISRIKRMPYHALLEAFFNEWGNSFMDAPASLSQIGSYNGGLLVQTVCVASLSLQMSFSLNAHGYFPALKTALDLDLLLTGALLFCSGTMDLYSPYPEANKVDESVLLPKPVLTITKIEAVLCKGNIHLSREEKNLLYHLIYVAYDNDTIKAMNREAILLQNAYRLYLRTSGVADFIENNQSKIGAVYDERLRNYLYFSKEKRNE